MTFHTRPMQPQDLDPVLALAAGAVDAPKWTRRDFEQVLLADPAVQIVASSWIAETASGLAGIAVVRWLSGEPDAEIEMLLVGQSHRRQGIGLALIQRCMAWAAGVGASYIRLEVRASNTGALALYRRLGFQSTGVRRGYYSLPAEDAIILQAVTQSSGSHPL